MIVSRLYYCDCNSAGSATTFIATFGYIIGLCFHLGTVLFTVYFPFRARTLETKGHYKYLHIVAVVFPLTLATLFLGIQYGIGGYSRTMVPIFCLPSSEGSFALAIVPGCFISAIFLTFVMVLLFKIVDIEGIKLKRSEVNNPTSETQNTYLFLFSNTHTHHSYSLLFTHKKSENATSNRYTSAQIKLVLIFCAHAIAILINQSVYSVVLRREPSFQQALDDYLECEESGNVDVQCDRSSFEELDPTPITFTLATIAYTLFPLSTLIYVANIEKLKLFNTCKTKLFSTKSTGSGSTW